MKDKICVCFLCFLGIVSAAVLKCGSPVCVELYSFEERLILYGKISQKKRNGKFSADLLKIE